MFGTKHPKIIDCKRPSTTKLPNMNRVQNIQTEIWKCEAVKCFEI